MSMNESRAHQWALYALAGLTGFVCGAFVQQEASIRQLFQQIRRDPYIYHHRHKLYPMVSDSNIYIIIYINSYFIFPKAIYL